MYQSKIIVNLCAAYIKVRSVVRTRLPKYSIAAALKRGSQAQDVLIIQLMAPKGFQTADDDDDDGALKRSSSKGLLQSNP